MEAGAGGRRVSLAKAPVLTIVGARTPQVLGEVVVAVGGWMSHCGDRQENYRGTTAPRSVLQHSKLAHVSCIRRCKPARQRGRREQPRPQLSAANISPRPVRAPPTIEKAPNLTAITTPDGPLETVLPSPTRLPPCRPAARPPGQTIEQPFEATRYLRPTTLPCADLKRSAF
ncbi:hypothetical protein KM043_003257 [Ampulex compressa]|nr:hypothetical protein KM043_003257 [Ampulex compressa]